MKVAVIPARGGSTRVPRKNIKVFAGKPMIEHPITAALESGLFERVVVSTDSDEIAEVSRKAGAEVPFMRPPELAKNSVNIADVVHHAVTRLQEEGEPIAFTCCIAATAPLLRPRYLREGWRLMEEELPDTVISVGRFDFPIFRAFQADEGGRMRFIWPEYELKHSNELPPTFHDAGQFYWLNTRRFLKTRSMMGKEVLPVVLPDYLVQDVDTPEDWENAEVLYEVCKQKGLL